MQYPTEVPGVSVVNFLRTAYQSIKGEQISALAFRKHMKTQMDRLGIEDAMVQRYVNQGSRAGEEAERGPAARRARSPRSRSWTRRTRASDIDSLKLVAESVNELAGPELGVLIITHYQRMLNYITPGFVHVMMQGQIVKSGGPELRPRARGQGVRGHPAGARDRAHDDATRDRTRGWREMSASTSSGPRDFPILDAHVRAANRSSTSDSGGNVARSPSR
jgi:Fe-S cluster assembly ATP-binding protein